MIRGLHAMFYSSNADELRAFLKDKLGLRGTDVGGVGLSSTFPKPTSEYIRPRRRATVGNGRHLILLRRHCGDG